MHTRGIVSERERERERSADDEAGEKKNLRGNVRGASKSGVYVLINIKPIAIAFMRLKLLRRRISFLSVAASAAGMRFDGYRSVRYERDVLATSTRKHSLQLRETNVTAAKFVGTISRISLPRSGTLHYVDCECSPFFVTPSFLHFSS